MPNSGRNPDEVSVNGPKAGSDASDVVRFPRPAEPVRALAFGGFVLDLARGALLHDGSEVRLRAKSFDVLTYLVRHPGRLIAKQELMEGIGRMPPLPTTRSCSASSRSARARGRPGLGAHRPRPRLPLRRGGPADLGAANRPRSAERVPAADARPGTSRPADRVAASPRIRRGIAAAMGVVLVAAGGLGGGRTSPAPRTAEARSPRGRRAEHRAAHPRVTRPGIRGLQARHRPRSDLRPRARGAGRHPGCPRRVRRGEARRQLSSGA